MKMKAYVDRCTNKSKLYFSTLMESVNKDTALFRTRDSNVERGDGELPKMSDFME